MTLIRRTHANARFTVTDPDADHLRIDGVTIASDRPVATWVSGLGRVKLRLAMKRTMIAKWRDVGAIQPDGTMTMLADHGSGGWFTSNSARDNIGRWHGVRIENRGEGDDAHKVLVADAVINIPLAARWLGLEPAAVRGVFEGGTVRDTSVGFDHDEHTMVLENKDTNTYRTEAWTPHEASFVWKGADDTGVGRSKETMTPEEFRAWLEETLKRHEAKIDARLAKLEVPPPAPPAPAPEPEPAEPRADDTWPALVEMAERQGEEGRLAALKFQPKENRSELLTAWLEERIVAKPDPRPGVTGGHENARNALTDLVIMATAKGPYAPEERKQRAAKIHAHWRDMTPRIMLEQYGRASGILGPGYIVTSEQELMRDLAHGWPEVPSSAERALEGGHFLVADNNAVRDINGKLDFLETMKREGSLIPADVPGLVINIFNVAFRDGYDAAMIPFQMWGNEERPETIDDMNVVFDDAIVPDFDPAGRTDQQDLPLAQMFTETETFGTTNQGFVFSIGTDVLFTRGGARLVRVPSIMGQRHGSRKSEFVMGIIVAGARNGGTAYTGARDDNAAIGTWLDNIYKAAGEEEPVKRPDTISVKLPRHRHDGVVDPNFMVYGRAVETEVHQFFAGRLDGDGFRPGTQDAALIDFVQTIGRNRRSTNLIPSTGPDARKMYAFATSGPYAPLTFGNLRGREVRIMITDDVDWRRLPTWGMRIDERFGAKFLRDFAYRNELPAP